jgi:two-component system, NtrC family, sensor kinase
MSILKKLKPSFWDYLDVAAGPLKHLFNFRRIWKLAVILTAGVALVPLVSITVIDYKVTQNAIESEILFRTSRLVSNTWRNISFFLMERKAALDFIIRDNSFETLNEPERLAAILKNLKGGFGGFVDLGVIDPLGYQRTYVGPYKLEGVDYSTQEWYKEVQEQGKYVSDVFLGFRHVPHLVIAVKHEIGNGFSFVLRATLDTDRFNELLSELEVSGIGDAFVINRAGTLQTPSRSQGKVLEKVSLPIPEDSSYTRILESKSSTGSPLVIGYAYIPQTPFILMIVKDKADLMRAWYKTQRELVGFLAASIVSILLVILGVATYLVNKIYEADQKRIMTLHQVEYSNKMASIGRLAAGVAHEINNPLAIINEKAGLIKDLFRLSKERASDEKLMGLVDSVISSVERCATITRRLLSFTRHIEVNNKPLNLEEVIRDVLGFLGKEAEYRTITVSASVPEDIPQIESDPGRLQEVLLNVINNSLAAVEDGGRIDITASREDEERVSVAIADNGCGIPASDLHRVFEPFFSTKTSKGGTGLGLSITSGLVQELGGTISVQSQVGKGTTFTIVLPVKTRKKERGEK